VTFSLKIELPFEGWIRLRAQTIYRRPDFGFAVRFVEMSDETTHRLERAIDMMNARPAYDE